MKKIKLSPLSLLSYPALFLLCGAHIFALILGACAIHEAGHLVIIKIKKLHIETLTITPTGLDIRRFGACSYWTEAAVSFAGPLFGGIAAGFAGAFGYSEFAAVNLCCTLLNLLPIPPLDGGCALRALLFCRIEYTVAEKASRYIALCTLFIIYVLSILLLIYTEWNATLLLLCAVIFSGYFSTGKA